MIKEAVLTFELVIQAGLPTRIGQWWEGIPFLTSAVVIVCGIIYLVCLLVGYDSFIEVCFLLSAVISKFQVYRVYTSVLFHGSLLHVLFNMMALVPLGSELERIMGSVRLLYTIILLATSNAIFHLLIALLIAHNPFHPNDYLLNECGIGFSGILFSMIVIETNLSGVQHRRYVWILLVVFQLLMTNVSFLGHLCGILSGYAYTHQLFNFLIPGASFFSEIESSSWLTTCVRRPKFILCMGGNPSGYIPTYSNQNTTSSGPFSGTVWRNLSSWMPQSETAAQSTQDSGFPGRGRTLGSGRSQMIPVANPDGCLQDRLLDNSNLDHSADTSPVSGGRPVEGPPQPQGYVVSDEEVQKLVSMGFEKTQVEVALAAADGDVNVAVEILMQQ
ncbi:Ubiquitin-associated domain, partial [Dillenia turbinata]